MLSRYFYLNITFFWLCTYINIYFPFRGDDVRKDKYFFIVFKVSLFASFLLKLSICLSAVM